MSNGEIVKPKKMVMARVAQEFNELMGLEPPIDIKAGRDVIIDYVREAAAHLEPDDKLTDETVQVLEQLQIPLPGESGGGVDESDGEPESGEPEDSTPDDGEPLEPDNGGEANEPEPDGWKLVYTRNEDESEPDQDDNEPVKKAAKKKAGKKKAKKKKTAEPKYTRTDAMYQALQEGGYRLDLIARVDELYAEQGGKPNAAGAKSFLDMHLPVLHKFGVVSKSNGYWSLK